MSKLGKTSPKGKPVKGTKPAAAPTDAPPTADQNSLATDAAPPVNSESTTGAATTAATNKEQNVPEQTLTLTRSAAPRKTNRLVIFNVDGRKGFSVQFLRTAFPGDTKTMDGVPNTLTMTGDFSEPKQPKEKETPEQRKARLAALPKLTLEQKAQRAEERAAKLREKLAAQAAKAAAPTA